MVWLQRFTQWLSTLFGRMLLTVAWVFAILLVLFVLNLLVVWHADFLYNYFMRRLYEDFFSSGSQQEMMLMLMQTLSH